MRNLIMFVIVCMLTGCAVVDLSTMETAEPTGKGKRKGMFTIGTGLNMNLISLYWRMLF